MPRNYTIDYIRLLAAFGVIFIHLTPSSSNAEHVTQYFSISAVPFFLITSLYLFQTKGARFDKIRFSRILIPYISWSTIYLISRTIKHLATGTSIVYDWLEVLFFGGAGLQLYFLPLLLCILITAAAINTLFADRSCKFSDRSLALFSIIFLIILSELLKSSNYKGFSGDLFNKTFYYILFAQALVTLLQSFLKIRNAVFFCSLISASFLMFLSIERGIYVSFMPVLLSGSILLICLMQPTYKVSKNVNSILSTTYGIYLCHHLFIEGIEFALNKLSVNYLPYSVSTKLTFSFTIIILSILFVLFIRRWKILSFLLLGEASSNKILESA